MKTLEKKTSSLPIAEARANLTELVNQAFYAGIKTIIGKRGKPQAVVISYQQYLEMEKLIANNCNKKPAKTKKEV